MGWLGLIQRLLVPVVGQILRLHYLVYYDLLLGRGLNVMRLEHRLAGKSLLRVMNQF